MWKEQRRVEDKTGRLEGCIKKRKMKVRRRKTIFLCMNNNEGGDKVQMRSLELSEVRRFKRFESTLPSNEEDGQKVKKRILSGWNGWRRVSGVIRDKRICAKVKGKMFKSVVKPAMLHGLDTVPVTKRIKNAALLSEGC